MNAATQDVPIYARPSVRIVLVLAAILGLILGIETSILHLTTDPLADVRAYYDAGARLNAGLPLYVPVAHSEVPGAYYYPPLLAIVFRPLALLPYELAAAIWAAVIVGATVATFWRLGVRRSVLIVAGLLALPIAWTVTIGQAQALITLLLAIGAPWAVALAANIKLFPGLVAVYWVGRREWRRLATFAAWMGGLVALQLVLEPKATLAYLDFVRAQQGGGINSLSLYDVSPVLWAISVVVLGLVALRLAPTRWGWAAAVVLSVFAAPRLLSYQLSTLLAALGGPDVVRTSTPSTDRRRTGPNATDQ
ncbi:MAG: glycosyltransferase 87 family protein [Chloroflexota bacterium]